MKENKFASFTIKGRFPSLNEYINACRRNVYLANQMKQKYTRTAMVHARETKVKLSIEYAVIVKIAYYEPNSKRDIDNISSFGNKVILDGIVKAGMLKNDSQRYICGIINSVNIDKENPRIEVSVWY